jgi:2-polyprenyl-6-methoxyphenol hydroxylase-like FAD-dependent oxidoreductase
MTAAEETAEGTTADATVDTTTCCIVGCGPAGAMLGLMLARSGVDVVVLEKYPDFFRDFRGDTIHASTLQILDELGLLSAFEDVPQQRTKAMSVMTDTGMTTLANFTTLPGKFQYIAMVPQWDFLNFITASARRYRSFALRQQAEAVGLIEENGVVVGVRYRTPQGLRETRALLTVAADGRHSVIRAAAGLTAVEYGAPMDVLWFRLPKLDSDPPGSFLRLAPWGLFPMLDRRTYWQGGYTVSKGTVNELKARGIEQLHAQLRRSLPFLGDRVETITSWDDVGFLEVEVNRLERWHRPGVLCIGDAAHAMSPIGGVGINLAIQDAVAAANRLAEPLRAGRVSEADLAAVQRRRELPTKLTQRLQLTMQRNLISPLLGNTSTQLPRPLRVGLTLPLIGRLLARAIAIGFRNEHVRTDQVQA